MEIFYLPKFVRQYKKLPAKLKNIAERKERIFRSNPFDPRLRTHKLSGKFEGYYAFSVNFTFRIIFDFGTTEDIVHFYQIGDHDIYD